MIEHEVLSKIEDSSNQWRSSVGCKTNPDESSALYDPFSFDDIGQATENIVHGLTKLGLTHHQAKVCVAVIRHGPASVTTIAKECSFDRGSTYRTIEKLVEMDIIEMELGAPNLYAPRNPERTVSRLLSRYRCELDSKIKTASEVSSKAEELKRTRIQSVRPTLTTSYRLEPNRAQGAREFYKLLREVEREVLFVGPARSISRFANEIETFKDACERGVAWRCITEINETNKHDAELVSKYCRIRHYQRIPMLMSIFDRRVVLFGASPNYLANSEHEDDVHIVLEDPTMADAFALLFECLWKSSTESLPTQNLGTQ
jgi:sugar-specific transcriptional regulator TrmB